MIICSGARANTKTVTASRVLKDRYARGASLANMPVALIAARPAVETTGTSPGHGATGFDTRRASVVARRSGGRVGGDSKPYTTSIVG